LAFVVDDTYFNSRNFNTIGSKMEDMLGSQSEFTMAMKSIFELAGTLVQVLALTYLVKKVNTALTNAITKIELSNHGITATALDTAAQGVQSAVQSSALNIPTLNDYPALITLKQDNEGEIKIATGVKPGPMVTGGCITQGNVNVTAQKGNKQLVVVGQASISKTHRRRRHHRRGVNLGRGRKHTEASANLKP
jgi:hypothetical protein